MSAALVQLFLCLVAGFLLWRLWRAFDDEDRLVRSVVALGLVGRAIVGTVLFWVSWLQLPFARSLQLGDGLWFFALDARVYMPSAASAASQGFGAIMSYPRGAASVAYVQTLAFFALFFGSVASVAVLLNLFCYLGSCLLLAKLRKLTPEGRLPGMIALVVVSLSPSAVLWSLQPLKDTFFQFLIIAFVAACIAWQRAWSRPTPLTLLTVAVMMFVTLYAMVGIRWYFAFSVLCASFVFLVLRGLTVTGKRVPALIAGLLVFATLTQAFVLGAGPYIPYPLLQLLSLSQPGKRPLDALAPSRYLELIRQMRDSFDRAGGATSIGVGGALSRVAQQPLPAAPAPVVPPPPKQQTPPEPVAVTASVEPPPVAAPPAVSTPQTPPHTATSASPAVPEPAAKPAAKPAAQQPPPPPAQAPVVPVTPVVSAPATVSPVEPEPPAVVLPESTNTRLATGAIAMFVPRSIAIRMGWLDIRGGKGLFWFTDLDTILFDIVILIVAWFFFRHLRWATLRNPAFWFVALVTVLVGVPLVYTITNFGTLFRLRMMPFTTVVLIPLALATARLRSVPVPLASSVPESTLEPAAEPASIPEPQA